MLISVAAALYASCDVVLHLVSAETGRDHALRLDRLGSAELSLPDGLYAIGLSYEPQG